MKNENQIPEWAKPENARWANLQWEPISHLRRLGRLAMPYFGDSCWSDDWLEQLYSERTVKQLVDLGINVIITHFFKGFGLHEEREEIEQLRCFTKLFHQYGIKVVGYVQFGSLYYETFLKEEPNSASWIQRKRNGDFRTYSYYRRLGCINSKEFINYLRKVMDYGADIGLDGFHFDNCMAPPCYCSRCTDLFREYLEEHVHNKKRLGFLGFDHVEQPPFRLDMPEDENVYQDCPPITDPLYQEWIDFRVQRFDQAIQNLFSYTKELNADLLFSVNSNPHILNGWAQKAAIHPYNHGKMINWSCFESNCYPTYENGAFITQIPALKIAEAAGYHTFSSTWLRDEKTSRKIPERAEQVKLCLAESAAFGGIIGSTWGSRTITKGKIAFDIEELSRPLKNYISFFNAHKELYKDAESITDLGMLNNFESFSYDGKTTANAFSGIESLLISHNLPYSIYFTEHLPSPEQCELLIVANQACLSDEIIANLCDYLKNGGKLLLVGNSGKYNENNLERHENGFFEDLTHENARYLPDCLEMCDNSDDGSLHWPPARVAVNGNGPKIIAAINELYPSNQRPLVVECAPPGIIVVPKKVSDRTLAHVINYDNVNNKANMTITLSGSLFNGKSHATICSPDNIETSTIKLKNENITCQLGKNFTYSVIDLHE